jgi:TPR repeat protein
MSIAVNPVSIARQLGVQTGLFPGEGLIVPSYRGGIFPCGMLFIFIQKIVHYQNKRNASRSIFWAIARRIASSKFQTVRQKAAKKAEEQCASGQFAAALFQLQRAISLGHLPSRALMAWLLVDGREGVLKNYQEAFQLVDTGARLGCHHCQGVLAYCYLGHGCEMGDIDFVRSLELASDSSERGSKYGQCALGDIYRVGFERNYPKSVEFYLLAAAQGLDVAQLNLGSMHQIGNVVAQNYAEALRLYQLAADQGHPRALYFVGNFNEFGRGVPVDVKKANHWYKCALAAGFTFAKLKV